MDANDTRLRKLQSGYRAFEGQRYDEVVDALGQLEDGGGPLGRGLEQAAQAMILDAHGQTEEAAELMRHVVAAAVPLPEVQRRAAELLSRNGDAERAHHAFLMADVMAPQSSRRMLAAIDDESERLRLAPWALRGALEAKHGGVHLRGQVKTALTKELGPEAAALVVASMRQRGVEWPRDEVRRRQVGSLIDYARTHGLDYEEIAPARDVSFSPPPVLGGPEPGVQTARSRTLFGCVLEDVVVVGNSNLLLAGDEVLLDVQTDALDPADIDLGTDTLVAAGDGHEVLTIEPRNLDAVRRIPEAFWLTGINSNEFGHWMLEFLPKVLALMERPGFAEVPILIDGQMHRQHVEALRLLVGSKHRLRRMRSGERVRVGRLWVASQMLYEQSIKLKGRLAISGSDVANLLSRATPMMQGVEPLDGFERVYLPRRDWQKRSLANANEVEAILTEAGFVRFDPWDASFERQLQVMRSARYLIATAGSALAMTLFARPGLRVGVLNNQHLDLFAFYAECYRALGHSMVVTAGEAATEQEGRLEFGDYAITPTQLRELLHEIGALA